MKRAMWCVAAAFAGPAFAGVNTWTAVGPEGGRANAVAFHPDSGVVLALAGWSAYRSTDGGATWTAAPGSVGAASYSSRLLISPADKNRVIASSVNSMFRSSDGGSTFSAISAPALNVQTSRLAATPDGSALYVAAVAGETGVYRSTDFGTTWQSVSTGLPQSASVNDLVIDTVDPNTLFALTGSGLYKTTNAGQQWTQLNALSGLNGMKLALDPGAPGQMLLATANAGLYKSTDGGATWPSAGAPDVQYAWVGYTPAAPGFQNGAAVAVPYNGAVIRRTARTSGWTSGQTVHYQAVYDAAFDPRNTDPVNSTLLVATDEGPLLSQNGGASFVLRSQGMRGGHASHLVASHDSGGTMYAVFNTGPIGAHRRTLAGWSPVDNEELRSRVPYAFVPSALGVDPNDPLTVMVASGGLLASFNGGQSWSSAALGGVVRSVQFAKSNTQVAYAAADPYGVYRSDDHGVTWASRSSGLPASIGVIAVDPTTPTTAYAATQAPSSPPLVYKTTNGGNSWSGAAAGIDAEWVTSLVIDPLNPQVLYAASVGMGSGLFKSANGGSSWTRIGAQPEIAGGFSIDIDPVVSTTLVMATNVLGSASRSVDGGATWEMLPVLPVGAYNLSVVAIDPLKPSNIVATANDNGLLELEVAPDLEVSLLTPLPARLALGGAVSATVRVRNHGPFGASAVVLTLQPPSGTTLTTSQPSCPKNGTALVCALGALRAFEQVDVGVTLDAGDAPAQGSLAASAKAHEFDPTGSNDSVSVPMEIARVADLRVALTASASAVDNRAPVELTATATNSGPNSAAATVVTIDLGPSLTYQTSTASQGSCSASGQTLTCTLGALAPVASATITVSTVAAGAGTLTPSAHVADAGVFDPAVANDTSAVSVTSRDASGGGGGGGAFGELELLALLALAAGRRGWGRRA
jgi:photosystem II stability/assembly factor-like uncharacterized protein